MSSTGTRLTLWLRWVAANAFGELLGLGGTFAAVALIFSGLGNRQDTVGVLLSFLLAVVSGAAEATVVGCAQWWAMRSWFPSVSCRSWWLATLAGALVAYILGYLPSTLMSLAQDANQTPAAEPQGWVVLLLAAGMGAVAGVVLSCAQWLVLRRRVSRAGGWIPANMLAWMVGMPIIFAGVDAAQRAPSPVQAVLIMTGCLFASGALVGGIHGAFLVRMAEPASS